MKVYLLCDNVDLGYHVIAAFYDREECQKNLDELVKQHYAEGWKYHPEFSIEEVELK